MAFSGGVFTRIYNWVTDRDASIPITASRMDAEMDGMATGLSTCVLKDGTQTITANIPMSGFKFTGYGTTSAPNARNEPPSLGQIQDGTGVFIAAGGTADALTGTYAPAVTAVVDGMLLRLRAASANATTTPTFAPNGLTARTITKEGGIALAPGDIAGAGHELLLVYRSSATRWELLNPSGIVESERWVAAGGTADALTATYAPAIGTLVDGMMLRTRATAANATTTPTFAPNGLTARTITREGGSALLIGDIAAAGHELLLVYRSSATRWELLNPRFPNVNGFTTDSAPVFSTDYLLSYDASATTLKKFLLAAPAIGTFTRDISTASGTQTVSGVGFKPRAVIFLTAVNTSTAMSIGFDNNTNAYSIADLFTAGADSWVTAGAVSINLYASAIAQYTGTISSFTSDGFVVTWTKIGTPAGTADIYYMAFP